LTEKVQQESEHFFKFHEAMGHNIEEWEASDESRSFVDRGSWIGFQRGKVKACRIQPIRSSPQKLPDKACLTP